MYDMSKEFNKFYRNEVVLPATTQHDLREKKKLNIRRLKEGLKEYNEEKNKSYKICEERVQGSMAMHTIVQNDKNDYDIDVAIVFEKDNLGDLGALATRNMVADALKRKTKQFSVEPEVKTSCVRVKYAEGYHIDFAIYRRYKENETDTEYKYEHAGSEWSERGIKSLENWFDDEIKQKGKDLRKVIRLSKMFCKSRDSWVNMPSGLIQTVLCDEQFEDYTRIDELFYHTMEKIVERLENSVEVEAPVDNGRALVTKDSDRTKLNNWKNRLSSKLNLLSKLFDDNCTYTDAVNAWNEFFAHTYWSSLENRVVSESHSLFKAVSFDNTEEFIDEKYNLNEQYDVTIDCKVMGNGFTLMPLPEFIDKYAYKFGGFIPHNFTVKCKINSTTAPAYDKILWKVRNVGREAERRNDIRGQILERGVEIVENTKFFGEHYIECYLIKDGVCIAIGYVSVPISR